MAKIQVPAAAANAAANTMMVVMILVAIALQVSILMWIRKLERTGCECSKDWRRNYIAFYCVLGVVLGIVAIVGILTHNEWLLQAGSSVKLILGFLFVVFGLQYVSRLKKEKCECSEDLRREILFIWNIIAAIFFGIALIFGLWIAFVVSRSMRR